MCKKKLICSTWKYRKLCSWSQFCLPSLLSETHIYRCVWTGLLNMFPRCVAFLHMYLKSSRFSNAWTFISSKTCVIATNQLSRDLCVVYPNISSILLLCVTVSMLLINTCLCIKNEWPNTFQVSSKMFRNKRN